MGLKIFLSLIFILLAVLLLIFYWFVPFGTIDFGTEPGNYNFSLNISETNIQFYQNMRYSDSKISYKIYDCPLQKKNDMEQAFEIISNKTILSFYSANSDEDISVTCDSKNKMEGGLFIAGEGGPTNITKGEIFSVILHGKILLIRESECERPNIALHELLHVLGFNHSDNPNNIMYPISKCKQTIGEDIPKLLNELYSINSEPDLSFENVSAVIHGRYLNTNITVRNDGLKDSEKAKLEIYADEELVKQIDLDSLEIGYTRIIKLSNVWIKKSNVRELKFFINSGFGELEKNNNRIILKIKK